MLTTGKIAARSMAIGLVVVLAASWTTPSDAVVLTTTQQIAQSNPRPCERCKKKGIFVAEEDCHRHGDKQQKPTKPKSGGKKSKAICAKQRSTSHGRAGAGGPKAPTAGQQSQAHSVASQDAGQMCSQ